MQNFAKIIGKFTAFFRFFTDVVHLISSMTTCNLLSAPRTHNLSSINSAVFQDVSYLNFFITRHCELSTTQPNILINKILFIINNVAIIFTLELFSIERNMYGESGESSDETLKKYYKYLAVIRTSVLG